MALVVTVGFAAGASIPSLRREGKSHEHPPTHGEGLESATASETTFVSGERRVPDNSPREWLRNALGASSDNGNRSMCDLWVMLDLWGQLEPCQCKKKDLGSMAHQVGVLQSMQAAGMPPVRVYAGGVFGRRLGSGNHADNSLGAWDDLRAKTLTEVLVLARPDVVMPGASDWNESRRFMEGLCKALPNAVLCSNAPQDSPEGVSREVTISRNGLAMRVRGVVIPPRSPPSLAAEEVRFGDPVAALKFSGVCGSSCSGVFIKIGPRRAAANVHFNRVEQHRRPGRRWGTIGSYGSREGAT
jgi:hypothetical protein